MKQEPEGVSTRSLLGAFFAVVVLCAVFFSLGFFLGYRQARPAGAPVTEQVPAASDVPSEVNAPESSAAAGASTPNVPAGADSQNTEPAQRAAQAQESSLPSVKAEKSASEPDEGQSPEPVTTTRVPPGLMVQVAAVTNRQDAANVLSVLRSKHYPALVLTPAQAKARDSFYRVVAGPYRSRTVAEKARQALTAEGFKPFIR